MYRSYYQSPIGWVEVVTDQDSVLEITFVEEKGMEAGDMPPILQKAMKQLEEYFVGKRKVFDLKLKLNGTEFQQKVWQQLMEVPYGKTSGYGEIARCIGNEKASRAVGGANNKNRLPIVIPCHRIIGADGSMIGYAGGLWRKEWLLEHEKKNQ